MKWFFSNKINCIFICFSFYYTKHFVFSEKIYEFKKLYEILGTILIRDFFFENPIEKYADIFESTTAVIKQ